MDQTKESDIQYLNFLYQRLVYCTSLKEWFVYRSYIPELDI
jgi:hypothetical protein